MGRRGWAFAVVLAAAAAGCASAPKETAKAKEYTQEEEMAAWMAVATPGPEHARMAEDAGDWNVAVKAWMAPDAPPEESTGTAKIYMILDGRFQVMEHHGSMMGMPFEGMGVTGYDNFQKKYVGTWCDSMGTMIMTTEGTADASGKVVTSRSRFKDPLGRDCTMRMVGTHVDADHMTFDMYGSTGGKPETKMMEMRYTRVK